MCVYGNICQVCSIISRVQKRVRSSRAELQDGSELPTMGSETSWKSSQGLLTAEISPAPSKMEFCLHQWNVNSLFCRLSFHVLGKGPLSKKIFIFDKG